MYVPKEVLTVIDIFKTNGFKAYLVGGSVRDALLGKLPKDYDLCTNALPEATLSIFREKFKVIETGLKHGTVTIMVNKMPIEVTTFRIDGDYTDNRRPDNVSFTSSLKEDLSRRDFTINAIAWNEEDGIVDYFDGIKDLQQKRIRCVGDPNKRFGEDALRMMRAIRFSAQLNFNIDEGISEALHHNHYLLKNISIERIQQEFNKLLLSNPMRIHDLWEYGLLDHFIPEYDICETTEQNNPYHTHKVGEHLIHSACNIESTLHLRVTMFLHDICKPQCKTTDEKGIDHFYGHPQASADAACEILKRMRYDNNTIERVVTLIKYHDIQIAGKKTIRKMLSKIGEEDFRDLLKVKDADMGAHNPNCYKERHEQLLEYEKKLDEILKEQECFKLKDLKVNGPDIMALGFKGRDIGLVLNRLLEMVLEDPSLNDKEYLIGQAETMK